MPTKLGAVAGCSMTRPCECGLGLRPWRLFGFLMEPVDRAPCFFSGSLTLGGCGLPCTERLAGCFGTGNGKIQGERSHNPRDRRHSPACPPSAMPSLHGSTLISSRHLFARAASISSDHSLAPELPR